MKQNNNNNNFPLSTEDIVWKSQKSRHASSSATVTPVPFDFKSDNVIFISLYSPVVSITMSPVVAALWLLIR